MWLAALFFLHVTIATVQSQEAPRPLDVDTTSEETELHRPSHVESMPFFPDYETNIGAEKNYSQHYARHFDESVLGKSESDDSGEHILINPRFMSGVNPEHPTDFIVNAAKPNLNESAWANLGKNLTSEIGYDAKPAEEEIISEENARRASENGENWRAVNLSSSIGTAQRSEPFSETTTKQGDYSANTSISGDRQTTEEGTDASVTTTDRAKIAKLTLSPMDVRESSSKVTDQVESEPDTTTVVADAVETTEPVLAETLSNHSLTLNGSLPHIGAMTNDLRYSTEPDNLTCHQAGESNITQPRDLKVFVNGTVGLDVSWLQPRCLGTFTSYLVTVLKTGTNISVYYLPVMCITDECVHTIPKSNITEEGSYSVFVVGYWEPLKLGKASEIIIVSPNIWEQSKNISSAETMAERGKNEDTYNPLLEDNSTEAGKPEHVNLIERNSEHSTGNTTSSMAPTGTKEQTSVQADTMKATQTSFDQPLCTGTKNLNATKVRNVKIHDNVNSVFISWQKPECTRTILSYRVKALKAIKSNASSSQDYVQQIKCYTTKCMLEINTTTCELCFAEPGQYTFHLSANIERIGEQEAVSTTASVDIRGCSEFETPQHAIRTCTGGSKVVRYTNGKAITVWARNAYCQVGCDEGYGFYRSVSNFYTCDPEIGWQPQTKAPDCFQTTSISRATLQYKLVYAVGSVHEYEAQFGELVMKFAASLCRHNATNCTMAKVYSEPHREQQQQQQQHWPDDHNATAAPPSTEVTLTVEPPVREVVDQNQLTGELDRLLAERHNGDNSFMALIDWPALRFMLPVLQPTATGSGKIRTALCCHECPPGYQYRHNSCVRCPPGEQCITSS